GLAVLPLQGEELLVAVAAQLLEERRAPPPRKLPLQVRQRGRELRVEQQPQGGEVTAVAPFLPGELHARQIVGRVRQRAFRMAGRRRERGGAVGQIRQGTELSGGRVQGEADEGPLGVA